MIKFALGTEYGLRALMELAARAAEGPISAREIARSQNIPMRFLEHQLSALHKGGIVESHRGANGGYLLVRDPSAVKLGAIIEILEGPVAPMFCVEPHNDECSSSHSCGLQEVWFRVESAVRDVLDRTTLADIVTRHSELQPLLWPVRATHDD